MVAPLGEVDATVWEVYELEMKQLVAMVTSKDAYIKTLR